MSDLTQLQEDYSEICSELSIWRSLMETAGWKKLEVIAKGQVSSRGQQILHSPLKTIDGTLEQEFMKGEASGIELFRRIPEIEMEQLNVRKAQLEKDIENAEREVDADGPSGSEPEQRGLLLDDTDAFGGRDAPGT